MIMRTTTLTMRRSHPPHIDVLNLWRFTLGGGLNGRTLKTAGVLLKMNKLVAIVAPLFVASTAMAQDAEAAASSSPMINGFAAGLAVLGAGLGIGRIGATACEATARQPEVKGQIFTNMLLTAALIEGVAFAAVILVG